jgi:hypothetical protein
VFAYAITALVFFPVLLYYFLAWDRLNTRFYEGRDGVEKRLISCITKNCSPFPPRNPFRLFALLLLAAVLLGACDSYNLSFEEFFNGPPAAPGSQADDGRTGDGGEAAGSAKAVTAFIITSPVSAAGFIVEGAKTIAVTVPAGTDVTGLIPAITHTGASISPGSGEAQDFTSPVTYTVTAEDGSTAAYTVTVTVRLGSVAEVIACLEAAANGSAAAPVILPPLELDLASNWTNLLAAIQSKGKHVSLDLSACTSNAMFNPGIASTGKDKIVSLVLPNGAASIAAGSIANPTFQYFSALKSVSGESIETIGDNAFRDCTALTTADFPAAAVIDISAFRNCSSLTTANLPNATTINTFAFRGCAALTTVNLPKATTIYGEVFRDCTGLTSVNLPAAESIGSNAFNGCIGLTSADFPDATTVSYEVFNGCTGLTSVNLPAAESIGSKAFNGCTSLTSVNLLNATSIAYCAFAGTGTGDLTVILGGTPPTLGTVVFYDVSSPKSVTVKAPSTALSAYGPAPVDTTSDNWGNAFRGKGWNGTNYLAGTVNSNINLAFDTY